MTIEQQLRETLASKLEAAERAVLRAERAMAALSRAELDLRFYELGQRVANQ